MTTVCLRVRLETIAFRGARPPTGVVFLESGEMSFPDPEWDDFVVVILGWYARAVARLGSLQATTEVVDFMDGPFAVELSLLRDRSLRVRGLTGPDRDREAFSSNTEFDAFALGVAKAASEVLARCRDAGHSSNDVQQLEACERALRGALPAQ